MQKILIIGGGLAGCEAAWYLAERGYSVQLVEMRPLASSPAHVSAQLAELVCSNSLKSESLDTGAGLLKFELRHYGSLLMQVADMAKVPAGAALAVDRELFAAEVTRRIKAHPNITVENAVQQTIPAAPAILACGPLAHDSIAAEILQLTGGALHFVDAISPVIAADSVDMGKAFFAGRYGKGGDDYLNLPMEEAEFDCFYAALMAADTVAAHAFEDEKVFESCMPIEAIAARGRETLLYGPMRPVGLTNPHTGRRPFAVVQLRLENRERTAYNIVGFQTKMSIPAQKLVLRLIPGLEDADFLRFGTIHRNTYVDAPACLDASQMLIAREGVFMAGQITGVEGYLESMASGIMAAMQLCAHLNGCDAISFHPETAFGSLQRHIAGEFSTPYTPSNFHFGMVPPLAERVRGKSKRKEAYSQRAIERVESSPKQG
ncbi:MAG: methylenetetrahydrofolate--tRNA-(uracil(54)-C(5))-methyltransferase (FADH(2)-oxidizing) TrmFO [Deferribacteraceae bacterium]|nr:methylenetetrahydrofolate--tRNA-(uracil(54)-C(5))-methyltransferase (FADH(2)-oxidizing) TrmFO [Deferribacteraceae bacterium]